MILELNGTKVTIVDKTLGYQGDNLVNTIQVTVDKDSTWNYKLDMYKGKSKCFDSVLMVREGNTCTVQLTNEILSYGGRYIFQLRGYTDTQTYHSDIFESWVNASIEYQDDCKQGDCECDCKLPTEFYQVEDNVTEINNHPPYPGDNNKWMIWDVDKHEYVESDIEVIGGGGGDYQTKANLTTSITAESTDEQYPSAKATYDYGQSIAQSAGKINAITVNGTAQTVEDKTAKIIVNKSTVGLGNVNNTSDNDKPVSSAQASAIADAKQAGTTAQANLDAHISNKENPHEVTKSQVGLSDVDNTSDKNKPVSTPQATAIADAKKAGTDAQANLTAHINDKENPHEVTKAQVGLGNVNNTSDVNKPISTATQNALNEKLDKTAVVDVTLEATKGQAADAKSVYDAIQAAKPEIVTPTAESTDTQAASAKAVWDMIGDVKSLADITGKVGDGIVIKSVDADGKPVEWESVKLAKSNGANLSDTEREAFRTQIAALPGTKIYCKDSDGKILAYTDRNFTYEANYVSAMELADYGNSLLIYGNKTYQCTGFESPASVPGAPVVAVYFRAELTSSGAVKTEIAKFNPVDYTSGTIPSPVIITDLIPASEARVASVEEDAQVVRTILLGEEASE